MNERDIKQFFAGASLSEQKKTQLKETLKKRFPQQNGDINTDTFTPQTDTACHSRKTQGCKGSCGSGGSGACNVRRNLHDKKYP